MVSYKALNTKSNYICCLPFIPIVVFNNDAVLKVFVKDHIVINIYSLNNAIL